MATTDKEREWKPNENMVKVLALGKECDFQDTESELVCRAGLNKDVFYHWRARHEEFNEWWLEEATRHARRKLGKLRNAVILAGVEKSGRQSDKFQAPSQKLALDLIDGEYRRNAADAAANANTTGLQAFLEAVTTGKDATETAEATNADET